MTIKEKNIKLSCDDIFDESCDFFRIPRKRLESHCNERRFTEPRFMIWLIMYIDMYNKPTLNEIGKLFNERDHATIRNGISRIKTLMNVYPEVDKRFQDLCLYIFNDLKLYEYAKMFELKIRKGLRKK